MLNQTVIVGRIVGEPKIKEEDGRKSSNLVLAVPRSYKNENGEYDTDFIDIVLWNSVAENTVEYCHKGDVVGIKGRIQTSSYVAEDGTTRKYTEVVAEKVTFLSSKKNDEDEV